MFTTLVESRAPRSRRLAGTAASALVHGALVAGAVVLTLPRPVKANPAPPKTDLIWIPTGRPPQAPVRTGRPTADSPTPSAPTTRIEITFRDIGETRIDVDPGPVVSDWVPSVGPAGVGTTGPMGGGIPVGLGGPGGAWEANQVDRSPAITGRAIEPRYPAQLRAAGIEGRVVLQFVVDTLGRAEPADVSVVETSHPLFAEAVREVLPRYRFSAGEAGGRRVRTRVQIPFTFTLQR